MSVESGGPGASASRASPGPVRVAATIALYLGLNSSLNLLNRYTLGHAGFRFPVTLTCAHLLFQTLALAPLVATRGGSSSNHAETLGRSWRGLVAIGAFMAVNIALNNASLLHLSLSFNQVIRASIPVVCAACAVLVEKKVPTATEALGLVLVALGVMMTVVGSTSKEGDRDAPENEFLGVAFCAVATLSNALMMTFSGKIMGGEKIDALRLTFYTSPVVLALLLPVAAATEFEKAHRKLAYADVDGDNIVAGGILGGGGVDAVAAGNNSSPLSPDLDGASLAKLVLLGCCNAVVYNWVHNKVIAATSATTTTVIGNVKVALLVLFSRVLFGETKDWTWEMALGAGVALGGFGLYSYAKVRAMRRNAASAGGGSHGNPQKS
jgi:drug/metabolite transporter (DMT)-like permease